MNPEAHEIERGLGAALRAMLAAWLVLTALQVVYAGSFMMQAHYLAQRSWRDMPSWLPGLQQALRLALIPPMVLLAAGALRYARASLAGDRTLALLGGCALLAASGLDLPVSGSRISARWASARICGPWIGASSLRARARSCTSTASADLRARTKRPAIIWE